MHSVFSRLIVAGGNNPSAMFVPPHRHWQTTQRRVIPYLDGSKETVAVAMDEFIHSTSALIRYAQNPLVVNMANYWGLSSGKAARKYPTL